MPLPFEVEKLDAIPEAHRALYVEKGGKFTLDVEGLDGDPRGFKSALDKERKAAREADEARKSVETRFAGIDPDKVRELMSKLDNDEDGKLLKDGKLDELVSKRSEKLRKELEKQVEDAKQNEKAAQARADKFSQRVLDNQIRAAATKAGLHSHAIEDALFRGRFMFALNEDGDAVQIDKDKSIVLGKDGKTPFAPIEWLESMREVAPHWFPASGSGGGASGDKGGKGGKDLSHLSPTERMTAARAKH